MYKENQIKNLHLEPSSFCNARCPMCARNQTHGYGLNVRLKQKNMTLQEVTQFFAGEFIGQLKTLTLCGNFGDPAACPEILSIIDYFKSFNPNLHITLHSNGGLRDSHFWSSLALKINICVFSIDGLEETNHLYRVGVDWARLMKNTQAFIANGGSAEWHFIVFQHNENQIDAAQKRAHELGFKKFQIKTSFRFFNKGSQVTEGVPVYLADGSVSHKINPPESTLVQHVGAQMSEKLKNINKNWNDYLNEVNISCKVQKESSVYVSADGYVFPCCWLGQEPLIESYDQEVGHFTQKLKSFDLTLRDISLHNFSLEKIMNSNVFQKIIPDSWEQKSLETGRLKTCARTCGKELDFFKLQFIESQPQTVDLGVP